MSLRAPAPPGSYRGAGLHLVVLCAFAFAQPLFDILGRNAPFFAVRGSSRWDVVIFALALVVLPPLGLLALEALAGLAHQFAATWLHIGFVWALTALVGLQAIRGLDAPAALLVAAAAAAGVAAAGLYARVRAVRSILTALVLAPALFLGLFLFSSPVSRLVVGSPPEVALAGVASRSPVVVVVLDELPTTSLMDANAQIDAGRYPSFARLARDGIWFRNATTVHEWTTSAVPAILTGRYPERDRLPLYLDHPDNLFTLLGGSHELHVTESVTHLCPAALCPDARQGGLGSIVSDVTVVYPHLVLPDSLRERITPLGDAWSGFRRREGRPPAYLHRAEEARSFVRAIAPGRRPGLFVLHLLLPHHPWEYLPDGKRYSNPLPWQPGLEDERWAGDPLLAVQAWQRHLLQTGFTDRVLGEVLERLRAQGMYDDALVVVTADHGLSFGSPGERRRVHEGNLAQIAFVPLFVKLPRGEAAGRVEDAHVETVDIVPTIAAALGVRVPWRTDGRSALTGERGTAGEVAVFTSGGERVAGEMGALVSARESVLARQHELFGEGDHPEELFRIGPHPELLGREVAGLDSAPAADARVRLLRDTAYEPGAAFVPTHVAGVLSGVGEGEDVVVAVGGRVRAVTRSYEYGGKVWFSAMVPESAFGPGSNDVEVFLLAQGGPRPVLMRLR